MVEFVGAWVGEDVWDGGVGGLEAADVVESEVGLHPTQAKPKAVMAIHCPRLEEGLDRFGCRKTSIGLEEVINGSISAPMSPRVPR